jgi:hypothetical protein
VSDTGYRCFPVYFGVLWFTGKLVVEAENASFRGFISPGSQVRVLSLLCNYSWQARRNSSSVFVRVSEGEERIMFFTIARVVLDNVGGKVWLPDGCILPARCAVCNKPVSAPPRPRRIRPITVYLCLCPWHSRRKWLLAIFFGLLAVVCYFVFNTPREGREPSTLQFAAFCVMIPSGLIFIHSLLVDPYFRGIEVKDGRLEVKGFGKAFRESLRPEEIVIAQADQPTSAEA